MKPPNTFKALSYISLHFWIWLYITYLVHKLYLLKNGRLFFSNKFQNLYILLMQMNFFSRATKPIHHRLAVGSLVCCGSIRGFQNMEFSECPKIYQGSWIKLVFFQKFCIYRLVVHLFAPSLKSQKWCFYRFTNRNIVLQLLLDYKHISLIFRKY